MSNDVNTFSKVMGKLLRKFRERARLTQAEVSARLGLSKTAGFTYISQLETGRIKNPSLMLILRYLKVCQTPWTTFFQKLSEIDFKIEHEKVMRQVEIPGSLTPDLKQKVDRDTALYETKIQYPKTPFQKLDMERVKTKIDNKVKMLLHSHPINEEQKTPYFKFADELFTNYDAGQIPAIFERHWQAKILRRGIINEIKSIVYKTFRNEQKRLQKQKALPSEKISKMAGGFLRYRVKIEPIETKVQKLLGELNAPLVHNQSYKDFARECNSALKKYYRKDPLLLTQRFAEIIRTWKVQGLKEEIMEKVKEITIRAFTQQK